MPCYKPLQAYQLASDKTVSKEKSVVSFGFQSGSDWKPLQLPCGQCVGCRLERSRKWAMRCVFESQMHDSNCFITLTFDDYHLQKMCPGGSLNVEHFQEFMKRLRKRFVPKCPFGVDFPEERKQWFRDNGIRFFHCGEYGDLYKRPHYHACIFGFDFSDKRLYRVKDGVSLYTSDALQELWPYGFSTVGDVTFESAAYVARYVMKKINGKNAKQHYEFIDFDTGEVVDRKPEYTTMSRRPGIGSEWFSQYSSDVYPKDFVTVRGRKMRPPRFFDNKLKEQAPGLFEIIKANRVLESNNNIVDNTPQRLAVREKCQLSKLALLRRELE